MSQIAFRNSFFAFLAMVLVAVATALVLNTPSEASHASQPPAAADGSEYLPADYETTKVVDARLESDSPSI